jgi:hypothetical protein
MTSRISAVAIALSIAFGFVGGAGSTQRSAKDRNLSGTIASSKRMAVAERRRMASAGEAPWWSWERFA